MHALHFPNLLSSLDSVSVWHGELTNTQTSIQSLPVTHFCTLKDSSFESCYSCSHHVNLIDWALHSYSAFHFSPKYNKFANDTNGTLTEACKEQYSISFSTYQVRQSKRIVHTSWPQNMWIDSRGSHLCPS